jgi:transposase
MATTRPPYHPEFRAQAVELVKTSGKPRKQIAADLGVSYWTLGEWVKQAEIDAGTRSGLTTEERQELQTLRRENWLLRQERDILKKAAAFFAQEMNRSQ